MIYVIAGSYSQYKQWCRQHELTARHAVYVNDGSLLRGRLGGTYVKADGWETRRDLTEILVQLKAIGAISD